MSRKTRVRTLTQLNLLTAARYAVYCPRSIAWKKPRPAAFMIHLSGIMLVQLFKVGMFIYEKPAKKSRKSK